MLCSQAMRDEAYLAWEKRAGNKDTIAAMNVFLRTAHSVTGGTAIERYLVSEAAGMFLLRVNDLLLHPLKVSLEQVVV